VLTKNLICLAVLLPIVQGCLITQSAHNNLPNIIIIYADDLGYGDLSSYGGDIPTPNIDKIGREGIRFTDFYVAGPVCTPSRYALLTGSYPNRSQHMLHNVLFPSDRGYLDKTETTLATYLKNAGYSTALVGKWHLGSAKEMAFPTRHGFDTFHGFLGGCIDFYNHTYGKLGLDWYINGKLNDEEGYATDLITEHAVDFIDQTLKDSAPFFLFLSYNAPHYGKSDPDSLPANTIIVQETKYEGYELANTLQAPDKYMERFSDLENPRKTYAAMVSSLDDNVGIFLKKLEDEGLWENTMLWFISDNGGPLAYGASNGILRGQKGSLWEGGIRVPAMVFWKDRIQPNQVNDALVCNVDLLPTIGSIAGFKDALSGSATDGIDISKVLFEDERPERDLFWKRSRQSAIRRGDWKLVNGTELYNLKYDIGESNDLSSEYPQKAEELRIRFEEIDAQFE
jgi:arylsulfatase A-like enzyme